jgi:NADH dehydrogenase
VRLTRQGGRPLRADRAGRVVVIGAGFGGLAVLAELARAGLQATLVDRHQYTTFQPLLYQVATGGLNLEDVAFPVRTLLRRMRPGRFVRGDVVEVDWERHTIGLEDGTMLGFDHLVLATGAATNFFGVDGAARHALPLYTLTDAARLRERLSSRLEYAAVASGVRPRLRVVVVGGGATGVEMAGALAELADLLVGRDYPELDRSDITLELLERAPRLLSAFHPTLSQYARKELERRRVVVRTNCRVQAVRDGEILVSDTGPVPYDLLVWAAGVAVPDLAAYRGLARTPSGRLAVAPTLQLPGHPEAFAIGDLVGAGSGRELPQLAQPAIQAGKHAARQLDRMSRGLPPLPFSYRDRGTMATIGRRAAVAELRAGVRLTGSLAWMAWLGLHLVELLGARNRLSVLLNWSWRYLAWRRAAGLIQAPSSAGGP